MHSAGDFHGGCTNSWEASSPKIIYLQKHKSWAIFKPNTTLYNPCLGSCCIVQLNDWRLSQFLHRRFSFLPSVSTLGSLKAIDLLILEFRLISQSLLTEVLNKYNSIQMVFSTSKKVFLERQMNFCLVVGHFTSAAICGMRQAIC